MSCQARAFAYMLMRVRFISCQLMLFEGVPEQFRRTYARKINREIIWVGANLMRNQFALHALN